MKNKLQFKNKFPLIQWRAHLKNYFLLTLGAIIISVNFHIFINPADIAPGGVTGITVIINHYTGWLNGLILLALNVPMLIIGFYNLGRFRFLVRTAYVVVLYSMTIDLLAVWWPVVDITSDLLLNALYGGVVGGIGTGLIYRGRGTGGGTGVLSRVIQLKTGIPVSQIYMFTDGGIIFALGLVFGWERALYSLIMLFVWGLATDYILEGPSVIRTVFIITDQPIEVSEILVHRLKLGVTRWLGEGMYSHRSHQILFCTVRRPDVTVLNEMVSAIDPDAFIVIGQGHQARGGQIKPSIPI